VRKLRYIAELDSKSAALQQQMSEMTAELRTLQEGTVRIGGLLVSPAFHLPCRRTRCG